MKKIAFISFMVVAVMGMMTSRAQGDDNWDVNVNIVNSAETPVMLSLANNNDAHATFPGGGSTCILQPGQSTVLYAMNNHPLTTASIQWNIIYNFYDGTDSINQRISSEGYMSGPNVNCALPSQSDLFSVSAGTYVDTTFTDYDTGDAMASWMGLSGTADKIVGGLIDLGLKLAGFDPQQSTTSNYFYSITIGQNDYNTDKLAGVNWVGWTYYGDGPPPPVTFVQGQQIYGYPANNGGKPWLSSQNLNNKSTIAVFTGANASIGTTAGQIASFDMSSAAPQSPGYTTFRSNGSVVQMSRNPKGSPLQYVAAFDDSSVWYYDGANVTHLAGIGTGSSAILQMSVNWGESAGAGTPQIVVGCADGQVEYYNGSSWIQLQNTIWGSSIMQLSAYWDSNNNLQAVVGLGNGAVEYWNGSGWTELHNTGWSNPVYQLKAQFWNNQQPNVLVTLMDGAILSYTPASGWTQIHNNDNFYCIIDMAPQGETSTGYPPPPFPTFLAGFNDGAVSLFRGGTEHPLQPSTGNRVQFISANWNYGSDPGNVIYVYSQNYQFTYGYGSSVGYLYPAIPSVSSACGDIDGDGKGDLISVEGSDWYVWYSSKQYSKRYGPYDRGVFGTPVIGDVDGDGQGDLIMVDGSRWYVWTSSSGYTKRLGPYDLGIHGLPAAGDIDGDGKADLVMAVGSNWYTWSAASKYQVRSGPYNVGISGTPKIADIDGDGLADLIVIVGSDWYVWFSSSGYQRFGPYTMSLP